MSQKCETIHLPSSTPSRALEFPPKFPPALPSDIESLENKLLQILNSLDLETFAQSPPSYSPSAGSTSYYRKGSAKLVLVSGALGVRFVEKRYR